MAGPQNRTLRDARHASASDAIRRDQLPRPIPRTGLVRISKELQELRDHIRELALRMFPREHEDKDRQNARRTQRCVCMCGLRRASMPRISASTGGVTKAV